MFRVHAVLLPPKNAVFFNTSERLSLRRIIVTGIIVGANFLYIFTFHNSSFLQLVKVRAQGVLSKGQVPCSCLLSMLHLHCGLHSFPSLSMCATSGKNFSLIVFWLYYKETERLLWVGGPSFLEGFSLAG